MHCVIRVVTWCTWNRCQPTLHAPPAHPYTQPVLTEDDLLALGPPKYRVVPLGPEEAAQARAALAARLAAEQPHVLHPRDAHHLLEPPTQHAGDGAGKGDAGPASTSSSGDRGQGQEVGSGNGSGEGTGGGGGGPAAHWQLAAAMAAAADFRRLALYVAGGEDAGGPAVVQQGRPSYGPWRPYLSRLVCNARLTAADHFQDTRHVEFELAAEGDEEGGQGEEGQQGQSREGQGGEQLGEGAGVGEQQRNGVEGAGAGGPAGAEQTAGAMPGRGMMYEPGDLLAIMPRWVRQYGCTRGVVQGAVRVYKG